MNEKIIKLLLKQKEMCQTDEIQHAIEEQEKLSKIANKKRDAFYEYEDRYINLLRVGTEKFFKKYPQFKETLPKDDTKMTIIKHTLDVATNNKVLFSEITKHMSEFDEFKQSNELDCKVASSFYEYLVAFTDLESQIKKDRESLFSHEYKEKMASFADEGVLLYFMETPDYPLLDSEISPNDFLDLLFYEGGVEALFSQFFEMKNVGSSMKRKLEDIDVTLALIKNGKYRSASRNLFALLDSEHKKAANAYEGIISKKQQYKNGLQRVQKINSIIEKLDDEWLNESWEKVNQYYAKVVATKPTESVVHRNSIVHGDYENQLMDVDKYSAIKLLLLWLNMRLIADRFCSKAEIMENLLLYLPAIVLLLVDNK